MREAADEIERLTARIAELEVPVEQTIWRTLLSITTPP
jgi:hypothetical protein